jgi:PTH1 family peptidyl-tRNA hydrolase
MYYIVGLGNPGKEHTDTRHNVGFTILEAFVMQNSFPSLHESKKHSGLYCEGMLNNLEIGILLPTTFMNASGSAVAKLVPREKIENMVVVYDDIDLALGDIKISYGRGDGGHNGIKSLIEKLRTADFTRVRVGIAQKSMWTGKLKRPKGEAMASYVLAPFTSSEKKVLLEVTKKVHEALKVFVEKGREATMNQFNKV